MAGKGRTDYLEKVFDVLIAVCGLLLLFGGTAVVFSRVLNISVPWAEELLRNVFVWVLFFGAAFTSKKNLIAVTIINDSAIKRRHGKALKAMLLFQTLCVLIFAALSAWYGWVYASSQFAKRTVSTTLRYPLGILTIGVAAAFVLMAVYQLIKLMGYIRTPAEQLLPSGETDSGKE